MSARKVPCDFRYGFDRVRQTVIGDTNIKLKYFEEVFTTEHWMVRIYRVRERCGFPMLAPVTFTLMQTHANLLGLSALSLPACSQPCHDSTVVDVMWLCWQTIPFVIPAHILFGIPVISQGSMHTVVGKHMHCLWCLCVTEMGRPQQYICMPCLNLLPDWQAASGKQAEEPAEGEGQLAQQKLEAEVAVRSATLRFF